MAYKEQKVERISRYFLGGVLVEEREKSVYYIRRLDCKCANDPYQNGCIFCNEFISPYLCEKCGNYHCKCDGIEDIKRYNKRSTF